MSQIDQPATDQPDLPTDLAELSAIAQAQDAAISGQAIVPGAPQAAPEPEVNRAEELGAMLALGVTMVAPALPFMPACYPPEVCQQIGTALDAVAEKYGWNLQGLQSPELALAAVALPPTVAAVMMGRQHFAEKREAARLAAQQQKANTIDAPRDSPAAGTNSHGGHVLQPGAVG